MAVQPQVQGNQQVGPTQQLPNTQQAAPVNPNAPVNPYPPPPGPPAVGPYTTPQGGMVTGQYSPFVDLQNVNQPDFMANGGAYLDASGGGTPVGLSNVGGWKPGANDYQSVQGFADQAYDAARRYLDPQQEQMKKQFEQDMINRGIDPASSKGMEMLGNYQRQISDQNSAATFQGLQFGQGVQEQLAQQGLAARGQNVQNRGNELSHNAQIAGQNLNFRSAMANAQANAYGNQLQHQLGLGQLDMGRQGQEYSQMMNMMNFDRQGQQYQDQLMMALLGFDSPNDYKIDPTQPGLGMSSTDRGLLGDLGF